MLKVRVMGTKKDILKFQDVLRKSSDIQVNDTSDMYTNKGTTNYLRNYMEVSFKEKRKKTVK